MILWHWVVVGDVGRGGGGGWVTDGDGKVDEADNK